MLGFFAQFDHSHKAHVRDADQGGDFTFDVSAQLHKLADNPTGGGIRVAFVASSGLPEEGTGVDISKRVCAFAKYGLRLNQAVAPQLTLVSNKRR